MSERNFRVIMGLWLVAGLYLNSIEVIYSLIGLLLFEGITNFRVPLIVCKIRFGSKHTGLEKKPAVSKISFESERALRFIVALFVSLPLMSGLEFLWWLPWFTGFALIGAGLSGICPMVLALRYAGLR